VRVERVQHPLDGVLDEILELALPIELSSTSARMRPKVRTWVLDLSPSASTRREQAAEQAGSTQNRDGHADGPSLAWLMALLDDPEGTQSIG